DEKPQAVIIAGDVYDKSIPSAEAMQLFDDFLCSLAKRKLQVLVISGNHDSPERLSFASRLIDQSGVHISQVYSGKVEPIELADEYGKVNFYMLPYIKPVHVRSKFPDEQIDSYNDAVRVTVEKMEIDPSERNVLITHQFVTGAMRSESEEISVGGADNIDAALFDGFDYVALGHIHGPQNIGSERVRYCGTPLKYSFSEAGHVKSVTVVDIGAKGELTVHTVPLVPMHDMRELRGSYWELTLKENYEGTATDDYVRITLTDEEDIPDVMGKLRAIYPNIMNVAYDNKRTRAKTEIEELEDAEHKSPLDIFGELYEKQNGQPMSGEQTAFMKELIERIWEESV
ncbi:MAG: exonuclease SbcCD subunit D, partial [Clostridia bacterium]|nr:exonuclease SbcCD subunit D [Clostridia bacterium]